MKKQILILTAAALTAVVILNGTLQMLALQPSAKIKEQQRLSRQRTMDASRRAVVRDPGLANSGW